MVTALIDFSRDGCIGMTPDVREATWELRAYLYAHLYPCEWIDREIQRSKKILRELFFYLLDHPNREVSEEPAESSLDRRTVDHVAGMTDSYAVALYRRVFFPSSAYGLGV